ncbi:putative ATP-dependent RNA helicase DDX43 [Babylonia areolata]|uniref:putative ATP-dependent RNA helicase DDX43 n=1 Tax=Babylonia areolata TaxID=304850 RepID=UPI003FD6192D
MSYRRGRRTFNRDVREDRVRNEDGEEKSTSLYVAPHECGKIIGRGGSKIRELQDTTQARIKVSRDDESDGTRKVQIFGSEEAVADAKQRIEDLLGLGDQYNNKDDSAGTWFDRRRDHSNRYENGDGGRGGKKSGSSHNSGDNGFFGRGQQSGASRNRADKQKEREDNCPRDVIYIDTNDVGRIIGRGGSKIKEIQEISDCSVKVSNDEGEFGEVAIILTGFKESILKAKRQITKCGVIFSGGEIEEEKPQIDPQQPFVSIDWGAIKRKADEAERQKFAALMPIIKEFYREEVHIKDMHPEDVSQFRLENNNIMVQNPDCPDMKIPNPVPTFADCFRHYPSIMQQIKKQGFVRPSPIQTQAWPILMSGHDLIGIAQTGTGKTLAFLLPALIHIDGQSIPRSERKGPTMLVLCPTRELALQIEEEVEKINYKGIRSVCVYGGGSRRDQIQLVKKGVEIIVATPGRLNDLVMNEIIDLISVTYLVLDEADRMLDMGFEPDIRKCLMDIRPDRQTVMTSATWPREVQDLAKRYMNQPVHVQVGTMDLAAVHSVKQEVVFMEDYEKKENLFYFLENMHPEDKVLVFCGKKAVVDDISSDLTLREVICQSIHGDREQCDRIQALEDFKTGEVRILIATDVASRGLDVKDVTHVLNFDFPRNIEEYVHRIGRTGRAGRTGQSVTFLTRGDWRSAQKLIDIMAEANQEIPPELVDMAERYKARQERDEREGRRGGGRGGGGGRRFGGGGGGGFGDFDDFGGGGGGRRRGRRDDEYFFS